MRMAADENIGTVSRDEEVVTFFTLIHETNRKATFPSLSLLHPLQWFNGTRLELTPPAINLSAPNSYFQNAYAQALIQILEGQFKFVLLADGNVIKAAPNNSS